MNEKDLDTWLTETEALLSASPPDKLVPPCLDPFSIVVLYRGRKDPMRQLRAFERVLQTSFTDAESCLARPLPFVLKLGMLHADALLAQFELICCDIISVFIPDLVVSGGEPQYLARLYDRLIHSQEFDFVMASLRTLPTDDRGTKFLNQFVGEKPLELPFRFVATKKKILAMQLWAASIGGAVELEF